MQCCVPFCKNSFPNVFIGAQGKSEDKGISFHRLPNETCLRAAWLGALGIRDTHPLDSAVVCSRHFLNDDFRITESGLRQIRAGAIPTTVLVCMVCLQTDCELLLLSKHKLEESYVKLTGYPLYDQGNLKQTVCVQCSERLTDFGKFRDLSLEARSMMMDLVEKYKIVTIQHMNLIDHTMLQTNHCVVKVERLDDCSQPDFNKTVIVEMVAVKKEEESLSRWSMDDNSMEGVTHDNEGNEGFSNNSRTLTTRLLDLPADAEQVFESRDSLKSESATFQCMFCFVDIFDEHKLDTHVRMHLENGDTAASSSGDSSLITDNRQAVGKLNKDSHTSTDLTRTLHTALSSRAKKAAKNSKKALRSDVSEPNDQSSESKRRKDRNNDKFTNNLPKSHEIKRVKEEKVPIQDEHLDNSLLVEKKWFTCDTCKSSFNKKSNLVVHIKTHNTVFKPFNCKFCQYKTNYKSNLVCHTRTHTGEKPYSCQLCEYKAGRKGSLVKHVRIHTGEKPYSCKLCDYRTVQKSTLVKHERTHTGEKPFSCKVCNYKAAAKATLECHMKIHTGEKPYSCELCDYKAILKSRLVSHMKTHTGEKPYSCELCNYKTGQKGTLVFHMRSHTGEKPYCCKLCDYRTAVKSRLVYHMRAHTGENLYYCKLCDYRTAVRSHLAGHMKTHSGEKPYACEFCDYKAVLSSHLLRHMNIHTGEKLYSCEFCDYRSVQQGHLKRHMSTHTGEKPYSCELCDYRAAAKHRLVYHMGTHTGEKPYSCDFCDYRSIQKGHLKRHMTIHTGEKP